MIRARVSQTFRFERFNMLKDIKRAGISENGKLFAGDTFLCDKEIFDYLLKDNDYTKKTGRPLIEEEPLEVIPEEVVSEELREAIKNTMEEPKKVAKKETKKTVKKTSKAKK